MQTCTIDGDLHVWDGRRWVPIGNGRAMLKNDLPVVMFETDGGDLVVYINGVQVPGVVDVSIEADRTFGYARCRMEFFCNIATGFTAEQKERTKQGLREILASLES